MPSKTARIAYTRWLLADLRYHQEYQRSRETPLHGEERERAANALAALAKAAKDAKDLHDREAAKARADEAGFF